jgi:hypothetical protein
MMDDTLLVDGGALPSYVCLDWPYEWAYAGSTLTGGSSTLQGQDRDEFGGSPVYPSRNIVIPMTLTGPRADGESMPHSNQRYRDVRRAFKPGREITLTRRMSFPGGNEDHRARAVLRNMSLLRPSVRVTKALVEVQLLDGVWYGNPETIGTGPSDVKGDVRTRRMTVTLSGASDIILTNETNGFWLKYAGAAGAGVTIDVEELEITGGSPGKLQWDHRYPFQLEPDQENVLSVSAGAASITYYPAYL